MIIGLVASSAMHDVYNTIHNNSLLLCVGSVLRTLSLITVQSHAYLGSSERNIVNGIFVRKNVARLLRQIIPT